MKRQISREAILFLCVFSIAVVSSFGESLREVADGIVFKNGDRLSGPLVRVDNDSAELHSAALGELKVRWADIAEVDGGEHGWKWEGVSVGHRAVVRFQNAVMHSMDSAVTTNASAVFLLQRATRSGSVPRERAFTMRTGRRTSGFSRRSI